MKNFTLLLAVLSFGAFAADTVELTLPELPAGKTITIVYAAAVINPVSADATTVTTQAQVSGDNFATVLSDNPDTPAAGDATSVSLEAAPDLQIAKTDNKTSVLAASTNVYEIVYSNAGDQDATGVVISETLPGNTAFNAAASTPGWVDAGGGNFTFPVGNLAGGGGSGTLNFAVTVGSASATATQLTNSASITDDLGNGADPNPGDNITTDNSTIPAITTPGGSNAPGGGGPTFTADKDNDGFSDAVEEAAGSDPNNAGSTPIGNQPIDHYERIVVTRVRVKLAFFSAGHDSIQLTAKVTVPEERFDFDDKVFLLNVGGVIKVFNVTGRRAKSGKALLIVKRPKPNMILFFAKMGAGDYKDELALSADMTDGSFKNAPRFLPISAVFSSTNFRFDQPVKYTTVGGRIGKAK